MVNNWDEALKVDDNDDVYKISVPKGVTVTKKISVKTGKSAAVSLKSDIAGTEIGPKAILKCTRTSEYNYVLVGPHMYIAILGRGETNGMGYYWPWFETDHDHLISLYRSNTSISNNMNIK
jgi:hypothetical protein